MEKYMDKKQKKFLFEVSWEVCNKVGGIYTVLRTKAKYAMQNFGANYILIGPWLENNKHFIETTSPFLENISTLLNSKGIYCRVGYWDVGYCDINEQPIVILVGYKDRYKIDTLLYSLWSDYGVDSLASNFEYHEPILFSTTCGEVIKTIADNLLDKNTEVIAHFHEWLCGAGILYLKKNADNIATIFTTHATVLGRALSGTNRLIYDLAKNFQPNEEAKINGVFAKHSMELAAAKNAYCFTTVSKITAEESSIMLNKYPDKIVANGLNMEKIQSLKHDETRNETRKKLLQISSALLGKEFKEDTLLWITSGRYEFHNKGYDTLLTALSQFEQRLTQYPKDIIVLFLVASNHHSKQDSLLEPGIDWQQIPEQIIAQGISTHKLYSPSNDPIIKACIELGLKKPDRKIHIVYSDAYLDGTDGVFDIQYEQILSACDLSLFLSFYEPWGYTPLESIAYGTPTITTDLAGFGSWIMGLKEDYKDAVCVLERKNKNIDSVIKNLCDVLSDIIKQDPLGSGAIRAKTVQVSNLADWKFFYKDYLDAYAQAIEFTKIYYAKLDPSLPENMYYTVIHEQETTHPRFRTIQNECLLPDALSGLRDIAYNFWWSWHESMKFLFQTIDPVVWDETKHNPVHFLNSISQTALSKKAKDESYLREYNSKLQSFKMYCDEKNNVSLCNGVISNEHPIAYFCMEYGLDECLLTYSGGLGILAGDYLKTLSDLNIPTIAIGLFYKHGYFKQSINFQKEQIVLYDTQDTNQIAMHSVNDPSGKPMLISIEILDKTIHVRVWEIKVGRIRLYLLDTDVAENSAQDRLITGKLYSGTHEIRLIQEEILGICGERLISEKLKIKPAIYHLNEGHSAFLLLERIKNFLHSGFSFEESCELVRSSSIFTTHTSLPAGNEVFSEELIKKYFTKYQELMGVPIGTIIDLARDFEKDMPVFSMTVLAIKLTLCANAVSRIHGRVTRSLWKDIWPGLLENEVPICEITNGIHLSTWVGNPIKTLYDRYLGSDWKILQNNKETWDKIQSIPDKALWEIHQMQKEKLLDSIRERIVKEYPLRNENKKLISSSLKCLEDDILTIGLARRFTPYKRNTLILRDKERLIRILTNEQRPVVLIVAGKSHPLDFAGTDLIKTFCEEIGDDAFKGHIIFLEEYDMTMAKLLVQGIDVWLNTPLLGNEACGTSGMKVGLNGGINFSIKDGWWDEAYDQTIGWGIESFANSTNEEQRNDMENMYLMDTLEYSIAPLYYNKRQINFNPEWVEKMKASIAKIAYGYNSQRMANSYLDNLYCKVANYHESLTQNNFDKLKTVVSWKKSIGDRFNTVKIKTILINGVKDGKIMTGGLIKIKVLLFSGKLMSRELKVELILVQNGGKKSTKPPIIIQLQLDDSRESGILTYLAEYNVEDPGFYNYGIRVLPQNQDLLHWQDVGITYWG